jgi:hypothetical protein
MILATHMPPPEAFAKALFACLRLTRINDLYELLDRIGLRVREVDSEGFEGALVRLPNKPTGIVAVNRDIRERGRKRFTILHEVGHFILPGHGVIDCVCKTENIETWRKGAPDFEVAANRFAAELLLPRTEVAKMVRQKTATISVAKTLSAEFEASLTAATLKAVDVTEEECAVVWSEAGLIEWCHPNDNFRPYIRVREKLSSDSLAARLMRGSADRELDGSVPAQAWVNVSYMNAGATIWEDSIHLPYYKGVLTILTVNEPLGGRRHEDADASEELDPREFTIGRRRWPR